MSRRKDTGNMTMSFPLIANHLSVEMSAERKRYRFACVAQSSQRYDELYCPSHSSFRYRLPER